MEIPFPSLYRFFPFSEFLFYEILLFIAIVPRSFSTSLYRFFRFSKFFFTKSFYLLRSFVFPSPYRFFRFSKFLLAKYPKYSLRFFLALQIFLYKLLFIALIFRSFVLLLCIDFPRFFPAKYPKYLSRFFLPRFLSLYRFSNFFFAKYPKYLLRIRSSLTFHHPQASF